MIKPYQNEEESLAIGELTVENRLDRVELYGTLALTKDKAGLALALQLKEVLDRTVAALQKEALPDKVGSKPSERVKNPFG